MPKLILRTLELTFYQLLICFVDRLSRLLRTSVPPDAMRLYRENLALKVQLDALTAETTRLRGKRARASLRTRAAQVWAYLATRANRPFQKHHLSASPRTIERWATKLRQGPWKRSVRLPAAVDPVPHSDEFSTAVFRKLGAFRHDSCRWVTAPRVAKA